MGCGHPKFKISNRYCQFLENTGIGEHMDMLRDNTTNSHVQLFQESDSMNGGCPYGSSPSLTVAADADMYFRQSTWKSRVSKSLPSAAHSPSWSSPSLYSSGNFQKCNLSSSSDKAGTSKSESFVVEVWCDGSHLDSESGGHEAREISGLGTERACLQVVCTQRS